VSFIDRTLLTILGEIWLDRCFSTSLARALALIQLVSHYSSVISVVLCNVKDGFGKFQTRGLCWVDTVLNESRSVSSQSDWGSPTQTFSTHLREYNLHTTWTGCYNETTSTVSALPHFQMAG
jgi:hypothetical protein